MEGVNGIICYYCDELILGDMNAFKEHNRINHFGIPGSSEASVINHPDFGTPNSFEPSAPEATAEPSAPTEPPAPTEPLAPIAKPSAVATLAASACAFGTQVIIAFSVILLVVTLLAVSVLTVFALLAGAVSVSAQMLGACATAALAATAQAAQALAVAFVVRGRIWNLGLLGLVSFGSLATAS